MLAVSDNECQLTLKLPRCLQVYNKPITGISSIPIDYAA